MCFAEDEEIDVVTVADKYTATRSLNHPLVLNLRQQRAIPTTSPVHSSPASPLASAATTITSSMSAQVAAMHNYTAAPSSEPTSGTSTPNKRSRASTPGSHHGAPALKRIRISTGGVTTDLKSVVRKLQSGHHNNHGHNSSNHRGGHHHHNNRGSGNSRNSSDSEDSEGRRAQHNVLERKRRNDLKSSFHVLRDRIPELNSQERAPKVVILKKATEYILGLNRTHKKLSAEYEQLQRTNRRLQERLKALQCS